MPTNEHVEDGLFQHRRVDDPDLQNRTRKDGDALHTRSVQVSSAPGHHRQARPDRGKRRSDLSRGIQAWQPAQRPNGTARRSGTTMQSRCVPRDCCSKRSSAIQVPFGILYYIGSKSRVEVPLDEDLRTKTLQAIQTIRELSEPRFPAGAAAGRASASLFRLFPRHDLPTRGDPVLSWPAVHSDAGRRSRRRYHPCSTAK